MLNKVPSKRFDIGTGEKSVTITLAHMKRLIHEGAGNWEVRHAAVQLVRDVPERNQIREAMAIFKFVRHYARYTRDPFKIEMITSPELSLRLIRNDGFAALDCDDYTVLGLSLLKALGYPVRLKVVSTNPARKFNHVYGLVKLYNKWIPFDAIRKDKPLGWETKHITRSKVVDI